MTRKITRAASRIKYGIQEKLTLGNLNAKRDWGYAPEFVEGMWQMMQLENPDDFVLATGETHTIREFADIVFKELDMDLEWHGDGVDERGVEVKSGKTLVSVNPRYFRPTEVELLIGDPTKAKRTFGWNPKVKCDELARIMAVADWEKVQKRGF